eukprot:400154_1
MNATVDGIPIVGHIKGIGHYIYGDIDGGDNALKSSSRTTVVIISGIAGSAVCGTVVAGASASIVGGFVIDGVTTLIDSNINNKYKPYGNLKSLNEVLS